MFSISSFFAEAQLAEASYAELTGPQPGSTITDPQQVKARLVAEGFSEAQATAFVSQWRVVNHIPDTASGFSATLFQNITTGEYTFALRGTAGVIDLSADAGDVLADGIALDQIVDMYNYWQRLTAPASTSYLIATLDTLSTETIALRAAYSLSPAAGLAYEASLRTHTDIVIDNPSHTVRTIYFTTSAQTDGIGLSAATVNVAGHSLGGHLAMAFSRLFASATNNVAAVNGAGFQFGNTNVNNLFAMLGGAPGFDAGKITNAVGSAAMNLVSQDWLFLQQPAGRQEIYTESAGVGTTLGHGAGQMTDSLAIYDLFAKIDVALNTMDPAVGIGKITDILKATSNQSSDTLERTIDSLINFFGLDFAPLSRALIDNRDELYKRVVPLQTVINGLTANSTMTIDVLTAVTATDLANIAQGSTAFAYRYALKELNPFAILGNNDLYAPHNLNGELNPYVDENTTPAGMTTQYLTDRATMLAWKNLDYTADGQRALRSKQPLTYDYTDKTLKDANGNDLTFRVVGTQNSAVNTPVKVIFGSDQIETLTGGDVYIGDQLYGGGGADTLIGNGGSDYLEGGQGDDTYVYTSGDGQDTILDTDGLGKIVFNGVTLAGGVSLAPGEYISGDKQFRYVFHGDLATGGTLAINGDLRIENFKNGDLGITLGAPGGLAEIQPTTQAYVGGTTIQDYIDSSRQDISLYGGEGNDLFIAGQGLSVFLGKAGNDLLVGNNWDYLIGGPGDDVIATGDYFDEFGLSIGVAVLSGGAGSDIILGGQVAEHIYGDMEQAVISPDGNSFHIDRFWFNSETPFGELFEGQSANAQFDNPLAPYNIDATSDETIYFFGGINAALNYILGISASTDLSTLYDDFIDGGNGDDHIEGGFGSDILIGGAGNDYINGGHGNSFNFRLGNFANLFGPPGDEYLDGGDGNDTLSNGDGNDTFIGGNGDDTITSGDRLNGAITYQNYLEGDDGNDVLSSTNRSVDGFDTLLGGAGNDALSSVVGNALLDGGTGNDIYAISKGHVGQISIQEHDGTPGNSDRLVFGTLNRVLNDEGGGAVGNLDANWYLDNGILPSVVGITRDESNLYLNVDGIQDKVTLLNWFTSDDGKIEEVRFENGTVWDIATLTAMATTRADPVIGTADADVLVGLDGIQNWLNGDAGDDTLIGGNINDVLNGGPGNDTLAGGKGDDILRGGQGNDTHVFNLGDGIDRVEDSEGSNTVQFGPGITPDMLTLGLGSLLIRVGASGDAIHLGDFDPNDALRIPGIDTFRFDDGTSLAYANLIARGFDIVGTGGNDFLTGTNVDDRFDGGAGNDTLLGNGGNDSLDGGQSNDQIYGQAGNDVLDGREGDDSLQDWQGNNHLDAGAGNDYIYADGTPNNVGGSSNFVIGGKGNDWIDNYGDGTVVAFNPGDGNDTAYAGGRMTLSLGGGTALADLSLSQDGNNLVLTAGTSDSIRLRRQLGPAPMAWPQINLQLISGGTISGYDFSAAISEFYGQAVENPGLNLSLDAILPSHLVSTGTTQAIGGALAYQYAVNGNTDALSIADKQAVLADASFGLAPQSITVISANQAPVLANAIADLDAVEDSAFSFQVPPNTFADVDTGDTLSYSATLANGDLLPSWLSFDAATRSFSGTPGNADVGTLSVRVNAADSGDLSASDTFDLTVVNVNDTPTLANAITDQDAMEYSPFSVQVPADAFVDVDVGDTLTYNATLADGSALPGWLAFDATTRTFSGTPARADVGAINVKVTATDSGLLSAFDIFGLTIAKIPGQNLVGAVGNDVLTGGGGDDTLDGRGGSDRLLGNGGDDTFQYFADAKWTGQFVAHNEGSPGIPGTGRNAAIAGKNRSHDVFQGGPGTDVLLGTSGDDALFLDDRYSPFPSSREPRLSGIERIEGGNGSDVIDLTSRDYGYGDVTLDGGEGNDVLWASGGNDVLLGGSGNDELFGGAGNDTLNGNAGADTMIGGAGNDTYVADVASDVVTESSGAGLDTVLSSINYTLRNNVENLTLTGAAAINATGNTLNNVIIGNDAANTLSGGAGADTMIGGIGDDVYTVDNASDVVIENASEGFDTINSSVTRTISANVEKLVLTGGSAIHGTGGNDDDHLVGNTANNTLTGGAGNDLLSGGAGNDAVRGDAGNDLLEGMAGNDTLADTGGNSLFNGGAGNDTMTGNTGNEIFIGGKGNDTITPNAGADIIAFNRGDGQDTINASAGADNTLSIGGGIRYADMTFTRKSNNLVLNLRGSSEKITLANWYASSPANKSVLNLQVIAQAMADFSASSADPLLSKRVANFDFPGLASAFDAAGAPANWALTHALLAEHLSGSDTEALGGDLAYRYGLTGTLTNAGFDPAVSILSDASFGTAAQAFQSQAALEQGIKRLS